MRYDVHERYLEWLFDKVWVREDLIDAVNNSRYKNKFKWIDDFDGTMSEKHLVALDEMDRIQFMTAYKVPMDENRIKDGKDLRDIFFNEVKLPEFYKYKYMDQFPVSILEVLVALSMRCDRDIEGDPDRLYFTTPLWFWTMVYNLKFWPESCPDGASLRRSVDYKCDLFMTRKYSYYGEGGLFVVERPLKDMRKTDIWMQLNWWLTENFGTNSVF